MKGFAVINTAHEEDVKRKFPFAGKLWGIDRFIGPYKEEDMEFNNCIGTEIKIPYGFEKSKVKRAYKIGMKMYGYVVSKEYNINYNPFFHHSCLIRALDFLTVSLGCDLRLGEVVIADASTYEGRNSFRLLLPFARRIILVTDNKKEIMEEAEHAMINYGTSVAVLEDPVKASERADAVVIASDKPHHKYIVDMNRPMLFFRFFKKPEGRWWFDNVTINFKDYYNLSSIHAQGYVDINNKRPFWISAEKDGFRIQNIRKENIIIMNR
ncbi:hypothetical protein [Fonticella tunisiensis]|uniref:Uncharacterized protein n=1 Tax=Fonticella tunisiensis TaxID=1096341 RepID=A0A4R7K9A4_9CLOT|nr:hypothetical protein [Fonticella tunisiensis]TDT50322.1 hypothetical protein EDD71_13125 [Fonticella tunisiensis]